MIKESAILLDGVVYTGHRHHNIIHDLAERGFKTPIGGEQGFVTEAGEFVTREEAAKIAIECGQVEAAKMHRPDVLFSEDLY